MSRLTGLIRMRASPPLALQITLLLIGGLIVAQLVTLGLTLLLPPPAPHQYRLQEIASALRGADLHPADARPLMRTVRSEPPSLQSAGWLVSERSRHQLASLLGAEESQVRLLFYSPLPFAGTGGLADMGLGDGAHAAPQVRKASMLIPGGDDLTSSAALGLGARGGRGAMPSSGGFPGGGFPSGGGSPGGGGGRASPPDATPPTDQRTASIPTQSPAPPSPTPGPASGASPASGPAGTTQSGPQTTAGGNDAPAQGPRPGSVSTGPVSPTGPVQPGPAGSGGMGPGPGSGSLPVGPNSGPLVGEMPTGSINGGTPTLPEEVPPPLSRPLEPWSTPPSDRSVQNAPAARSGDLSKGRTDLDDDGLIAPAPWVAARTGDTGGWIVSSPQMYKSGLFGLGSSPFVQGDFVASLESGPGRWITVQPRPEPFPNTWQRRIMLWFVIAFALVGPIGWMFARSLARPLDQFASAAERLGRDPSGAAAQLAGPAEIGRAARAFNGMQARLKRFVDDRTAMVGAISHDLRTPLARMRFRMERAPDELKAGMLNDIGQMEDMISSVLVFIRDASEPSLRERVDLRSILECVVDDAALMGGDAVLETGDPLSVEVDSLGVQRVLTNLVDNALKYGTRAEVRMYSENGDAVAEVADDGPGLHPDDLERVFLPFYRSEAARTLNKGGIGLGLAVSRSIARAHGGDIRLISDGEGVKAQLRLPLALKAA